MWIDAEDVIGPFPWLRFKDILIGPKECSRVLVFDRAEALSNLSTARESDPFECLRAIGARMAQRVIKSITRFIIKLGCFQESRLEHELRMKHR